MIVALNIWELVIFPLITRSTIAPLPIFAVTFAADGVGVGDDFGDGVGEAVDIGVEIGVGVGVAVGEGVGVDVGMGVGEAVTVNELLVPVGLPKVAVIVTAEPAVFNLTEVDPTPLTKSFILVGIIDPAETVKDGVPVKPATVLLYTSSAVTVMLKAEPAV